MLAFEIKLLGKNMFSWAMTLISITLIFVLVFPFMTDSGLLALISDKIEMVPEFVIRMFGLGDLPDFTQFRPYFNLCVFYIQLKLCTIASLMGCEALISEETDGTIEFLYAQPKKRISILLAKFFSRVIMVLLLNLAYAIVSVSAMYFMGEDPVYLIKSLAYATIPQISYLMLGMLISAILPSSQTASTSSMSLFFLTYATGLVPHMIGRWFDLCYLSPSSCVTGYTFMTDGYMPEWTSVGIIGLISLGALIFSAAIYIKKDMKLQ